MKNSLTAAFIIALLFVAAWIACQHLKQSRDARNTRALAGTWHAHDLGAFTVRPDGAYVWLFTNLATDRVVTLEGAFKVQSGVLINTVTKSSRTNARVPYVSHSQIVRVDDQELVIIDGDAGGNVQHTFRKETK